jgi:predicted enzyme related to lactoylglutathione lyase
VWNDLTVAEAEMVRDFCSAVVGWKFEPVEMGGYSDYNMNLPSSGQPVAGVCHARGVNADLPAQWLLYVAVESLDRSVERCLEHGGRILAGPKDMGSHSRYCVIQDPAGAVIAVIGP